MRPSAGQFVRTCHREFRYLVDQYGFTRGPLVFSGTVEPFGVCFQGPELALIVQGIQWGSASDVYLQTSAAAASVKRFDELRMRSELPAHWLLDQRLPGWRSRSTGSGQLAQVHDYATALRSCCDDLFSGDLSALPGLFAGYIEHRRQEDLRSQQEAAEAIAQSVVQEAERPRTLLEQVKIVQGIIRSIGHLGAECRMLLKALGKSRETSSLLRFEESWRVLAERLKAERAGLAFVQPLEASPGIAEGLRSAQETATLVQEALTSGQTDPFLTVRVVALEHQSQELATALGLALEALS